jgi:hypothetical protein
MVSKNVLCSLRIEAISSAIPEMRYIVVKRDPIATAASILASRVQLHGTYDAWFSVRPPNVDDLRTLPAEQQVLEQIRAVHGAIDNARADLAPGLFSDVTYESLVAQPERVVEGIGLRLELRRRPDAEPLPSSFEQRHVPAIEPGTLARLRAYVASHE